MSFFDLAAIVLTGLLVATAQAFMTIYARQLPRRLGQAIRYSALSLTFYGFMMLYVLAAILAVYLFARLPLAQVSVSIMAATFLAVVGYTFILRQRLNWRQGAGVMLVLVGFYLLQ